MFCPPHSEWVTTPKMRCALSLRLTDAAPKSPKKILSLRKIPQKKQIFAGFFGNFGFFQNFQVSPKPPFSHADIFDG